MRRTLIYRSIAAALAVLAVAAPKHAGATNAETYGLTVTNSPDSNGPDDFYVVWQNTAGAFSVGRYGFNGVGSSSITRELTGPYYGPYVGWTLGGPAFDSNSGNLYLGWVYNSGSTHLLDAWLVSACQYVSSFQVTPQADNGSTIYLAGFGIPGEDGHPTDPTFLIGNSGGSPDLDVRTSSGAADGYSLGPAERIGGAGAPGGGYGLDYAAGENGDYALTWGGLNTTTYIQQPSTGWTNLYQWNQMWFQNYPKVPLSVCTSDGGVQILFTYQISSTQYAADVWDMTGNTYGVISVNLPVGYWPAGLASYAYGGDHCSYMLASNGYTGKAMVYQFNFGHAANQPYVTSGTITAP